MIDGHGDDVFRYGDQVKLNFSSNVYSGADLSDLKEEFGSYQVLVFFTPAGIRSLKENFPDWEQGDVKIAAWGDSTQDEIKKLGYRLDIEAPTDECKSMSSALEKFITANNKKK